MDCKNCGYTVEGYYCAQCGQSGGVDRINFPNFVRELSGSVFQVDRGFLYTLRMLSLRPGHSIREYLQGKRRRHFKPIAYVLIMSTAYFLATKVLDSNTVVNDFMTGFSDGADAISESNSAMRVMRWLSQNYGYFTLLLLPLYSLASWLAFRKAGYNYFEHIVLNAYITGQQAIIYIFSELLTAWLSEDGVLSMVTIALTMAYAFWVFWQFFSGFRPIGRIIRSVLAYVNFWLLFIALFLSFLALMEFVVG